AAALLIERVRADILARIRRNPPHRPHLRLIRPRVVTDLAYIHPRRPRSRLHQAPNRLPKPRQPPPPKRTSNPLPPNPPPNHPPPRRRRRLCAARRRRTRPHDRKQEQGEQGGRGPQPRPRRSRTNP